MAAAATMLLEMRPPPALLLVLPLSTKKSLLVAEPLRFSIEGAALVVLAELSSAKKSEHQKWLVYV